MLREEVGGVWEKESLVRELEWEGRGYKGEEVRQQRKSKLVWEYKVGEETSDAFLFIYLFQLFVCLSLNEFVRRQFWSLNIFESLKEPNEIGIKFHFFFFFSQKSSSLVLEPHKVCGGSNFHITAIEVLNVLWLCLSI